MPEIVDELPPITRGKVPVDWKRPALDMARDNPGRWVRCDGAHTMDAAYAWHWQRTGPGVLPDGFVVAGRKHGREDGSIFVYVRWVGETDGT